MGALQIIQVIEDAARQWPDAPAFELEGRAPLRYAELRAHVARTISRLRELGVGPGDRVAVVLPNGPEMGVVLLAIAASGAACAPLNPAYLARELDFYLGDLGAHAVVVERGADGPARAVAVTKGIQIIDLAIEASAPAGDFTLRSELRPVTKLPPAGGARSREAADIALLLHTSGTTSTPKLVPLSEANLCASAHNVRTSLELTFEDRCLDVMPLFHMHGLMAMLASLTAGASVVSTRAFIAPRFVEWLEHYRPTWFTAVPTMHRAIATHARSQREVVRRMRLRFLRSASAPLAPDLMAELEDLFNAPVIECYGMTEASNQICASPLPPRARKPGSVGIAQGTEIAILDEAGRFVPPGQRGEIVIMGPGVTRGYQNNPAANEKARWNGWFRTGDLGHLDQDGYLFIAARINDIINRGGEKVSPREIEEVLLAHPAVDQAVVFAVPHPTLGDDIGAAVVLGTGHTAADGELRDFAARRLAPFKVPAHLKIVEELPKGPTGKVQRKGLAERLGLPPRAEAVAFVAPRSAIEERIAMIWRDTLGVARIGVDDEFRDVGGDSVLAQIVLARIKDELGVGVTLHLLQELTIAAMAARVDAALRLDPARSAPRAAAEPAPGAVELPSIEPDPTRPRAPFPLIDLQRAYWVAQKTSPGPRGGCHLYFERDLEAIDVPRLERAWQAMIARHEMLRAFVDPEGSWHVLEDPPPYRFAVEDLAPYPADQRDRILLETRARMAEHSPGFETWPTFEIRVHRLAEGRARIHVANNLIILDFASWVVLEREWKQVYDDPDAALPPLGLTFRDYALGIQAAAGAPAMVRARAYWDRRLPTLPGAPALPQRADDVVRWRHGKLRFEPATWSALKQVASERGLTPAFLTCAAYAETVARFTKEPHFTLNVLTQNRHLMHPQVPALVARMSGTLPLEVDFRHLRSFAARAARLQDQFLADYRHRHFTGVEVARSLNKRTGSGNVAPFPIVFASMLGTSARECVPMGWLGPVRYRCMRTPQVVLDHQSYEDHGALVTQWDLVESSFLPGVPEAMMEAYRALLTGLAHTASAWDGPSHARTPQAAERQRRLAEPTAPAAQLHLHALFERQVARSRDRPAIIAPAKTLSHGELERCSNALARRLRIAGARPEMLVAIAMEKGWEQVVAALAILKAGAAYLPIDLALVPDTRARQLLAHGEVSIVVTQPSYARSFGWPPELEVLVVDDSLGTEDAPRPSPVQRTEDLAYVIYTSGSTGAPKGVMIDHGAVVNTILDVNARFGVIEQDRVLALSSLGFDLSVWDIFGVLAAGGALVIPGPSDRLDPARWATLCRQHGVTLWNTVPKLMEMLVEHLEDSAAQLPAQLRVVMMSGDWIPVALPDRIRTASAVAPKIVSFGGATEASIWSICYPIDVVDPAWPSIPYGKAMRNQTMHVLDPALCERESWVRGEIFIGGQGLARGYWREPDKTAARFVAHPGGTGRLYRTGDLGRYLPDGNIELLGREDSEVKVRGYRIELGEIEAVLNGHAAVRTSCITVRNVVGGQAVGADKQIVAYVVPKDGEAPSPSALRAYLEALLPVYMVPSHVVLIRSIPLSPNGKVDRQALPAPEQPAPSREEVQPPRDEVERRIAAIWRDLLQVSTIGVHDNFFALGGDSVLAIRMLARVRRETGVELGAAALFDGGLAGPSIETLGRRVSAGNAVAAMALVPIQPNGDRRPLFAVHAVGGTVLSYAKLALLLPPDQPLYGLQSVERPSDAPENLSAMAARYVEAIRRLQPLGPYRLGGWSLGGLIAFEMARQLAAAGQSIERLILIDSFAPGPGAEDERPPPATRDLVAWFARDVCGRFDADVVGDAPAADESTELQLMYGRLRRRDLLPGDLPERDFVRLYASYKQNAYAGRGYQGGAYRGSITLVCAETPPPPSFRDHPALRGPEIDDPDLGWGPFVAGTIDRYLVPGDHYAIVQQPGIERLAAQLSAVLRLADAR